MFGGLERNVIRLGYGEDTIDGLVVETVEAAEEDVSSSMEVESDGD